ncbi:MAG: PEP-CTERM sorting domain-containing protein [Chromatiaceae bacterium]|nr:PEP-CTERM sorting domain-containing protein [Gammaproteobacteria bacterium]MCP5312924.1 PEP-CTERM sorting domain-containing protein [Chromatiaceae bacterium]
MDIRTSLVTLSAVLSLGVSSMCQAAIVQVFDSASLSPDPFRLHDFETITGGIGATYSSGSGIRTVSSGGASSGVTTSGVNVLTTNGFPEPINITFDAPASSVGLFFGNDEPSAGTFDAFLDIYDATGLIGSVSVTANGNDFVDQFIGFNSDELVTEVSIRYGDGTDVALFTVIDDVQFNVAADADVPEPAALALLGLGFVGLGYQRRKRQAI